MSSPNAQPKQRSDISWVTWGTPYILEKDDKAKSYRRLVGGSISFVHIGVIVSTLSRSKVKCS